MGTSLKTVSLRLTSTSAELEQMGEDTEYACETMSDYRDLVMGLTHNKVDILGDDGQYKNTYNILKDISGVFDEMSSMEQSSLLKSLFGVRQANSGAAILQNFDIAEKSLASATNSDGSAEKELENWNQGIEAHVARAKESFEELANDTINSSLIKGSVDIGSGLLKALDAIVDKFGALPPLIGLISAGLSGFKNIGIFTTIDNELTGATKSIGLFGKSWAELKTSISDIKTNGIGSLFNKGAIDVSAIERYNKEIAKGTDGQKAFELASKSTNTATKNLMLATDGATVSTEALASAQKSSTIASRAASLGMKALSAAGNMIAGMAIAWAIGKAIEGIDNLIHATEKAKEKIADLSSEYDEGVSNLGSLNSELDTTKSKIDELESKGNLTFTEKDELENLKQQNAELQRSIDLQEQKNKTSATKTVGEIRDDIKKLNKGFTSDLTDYTDKGKEVKDDKLYYDTQKRNGASSNYLSNIAETMAQDSDDLASRKDAVIQNIQDYQSYKEAIVNAYGEDKTYWDKNTLDMYDGFNKQIEKAYKAIYSKSQYNKFVVEPVFDKEGLEGMQEDLLAYFSKNGSLDESELRKKFGTSIISALKSACEDAGIDFAKMLSDMNDNAQQALDNFAPEPKNVNSSYDAQQKANSDAKRELFNGLSDEDKTLVINAEVPDEVKNGTEKDMQEWINKLKTDVANNPVKLNFDSAWESLSTFKDSDGNVKDLQKDFIDLANAGELTTDSFKGLDGASELLDKTKLPADELVDKINELSSSAHQLSSMQSGISGLSSILETKKSNSSTPIGADVLSGLPEEVKHCTKEYEDFVEVLGNGNSSFADCQKATDDLASAYVNSNNFLANLTDSNKDYYIAQLSNMGVQNAEEVVMDSLAQKTKNLAAEKEFATSKGHDLSSATYEEVSAFAQEQGYSDATTTALLQLALQKQLVNGTTLDFSGDLTNIQNYLEGLGKASSALATLQAQKNAQASGKAYSIPTSDQSKIKSEAQSDVDSALSKKVKTKLDIKPTSSNSSSGSGGSSGSSKEATKTKEIIDNIAPALEKLKTVASEAKDKIDDLLNFNAKKNQTKDAISATSKAIIAEQKAVEKYEKYAKKSAKEAINGKNGVSKSTLEKYEKLVRDGSLGKNAISTIKNEKLKTAISDYKSWYSSAKSCNEEIESLNDTLKDLYSTLANNPIEKAADSIDKLSKKMDLSNTRLKNTNNID